MTRKGKLHLGKAKSSIEGGLLPRHYLPDLAAAVRAEAEEAGALDREFLARLAALLDRAAYLEVAPEGRLPRRSDHPVREVEWPDPERMLARIAAEEERRRASGFYDRRGGGSLDTGQQLEEAEEEAE